MTNANLTADEKASLTDLARKLVDRGARAGAAPAAASPPGAVVDSFSEEGRLQRILALEKRLDDVSRAWSATLNTVLFTVERVETRLARLEGEVEGLHESGHRLEEGTRLHRQELAASAAAFGDETASRLEAVLDRVDALVAASRDA